MRSIELSIIILNYNTPLYTLNCVKSLYKNHKIELDSDKYEIILVDNKSTDNSVRQIEIETNRKSWRLSFIKSRKNAGFGAGCNIGAKKSKAKFLLFLNSDTVVKDKSINKMLDFMNEHTRASFLGGAMIDSNRITQPGCGIFPNFYHSFMMFLGLGKNILIRRPEKISRIDWITGGCMMVSKKSFDLLRGFDENIFMYLEDMEICYRARLKNQQIYYFPFTRITHHLGKSSSHNFAIINAYKGHLYFYKKHKNKLEYLSIKFLFAVKFRLQLLYGRITLNKNFIDIYSELSNKALPN